MKKDFVNFILSVVSFCPRYIESVEISATKGVIFNVRLKYLYSFICFIRFYTFCQMEGIVDLTGVDKLDKSPRFILVYLFMSYRFKCRFSIQVRLDELDTVPSIVGIFPGAGWLEREVFDLFGLYFTNHPDLRRIVTDYGFEGHPLRKDFPVMGYFELRYDDELKRVVSEPLELTQEYRNYRLSSSWNELKDKYE